MNKQNIKFIMRTDEIKNLIFEKEGYVTLATIHAIKGLEAEKVFVVGCNEQNFPCKASDHPVISMIKIEEYKKEEEEKRLFYVALSRAKNELYLTYSGKTPTYFINEKMLAILNQGNEKQQTGLYRYEISEEEIEEEESGYFGKFDSSEGNSYSKDYNPYDKEDWDDMIS